MMHRRMATGRADALAQDWTGPVSVAPGQTQTLAGIIRSDASVGAGGVIAVGPGQQLTIFGDITGPSAGQGTISIGDGATFYGAGSVDPSMTLSFAGSGGTLELAGLYLAQAAGGISGFGPGNTIDLVSCMATSASLAAGTLSVLDGGTVIASLTLTGTPAAGSWVLAVPDGNDGTRLIPCAAMPALTPQAPAGTGGQTLDWGGAASGQWADSAAWLTGSGAVAAAAPGATDSVSVSGGPGLALAGDGNAARLSTSGIVALAGSFTLGALAAGNATADALALTAGCDVRAGTVTVRDGVVAVQGTGAILAVSGAASIGTATLWLADGGAFTATSLDLAGGTLAADPNGSGVLGAAGTEAGALAIGVGGVLSGFGWVRAPVLNTGAILAAGGTLAFYGAVTGGGGAAIAPGATLYLPDGMAGGSIMFQPGSQGGTLELYGATCAAAVVGVSPADAIDVAAATITQASWTPSDSGGFGTLDLGGAGTLEVGLAAGAFPAAPTVQLTPDGLGGTLVQLVPCFAAATLLATPDGSVAAGAVRPGMRLLTRSGAARRVRWVGRRDCDAATLAADPQLRPVIFDADAFGPGRPCRPLILSPQHAVLLPTSSGPRLVPAVALVDGRRIRRAAADVPVRYVHLELDTHDILLAEGLAVESFWPGVQARTLFRAAAGRPAPGCPACVRRLEGGFTLEALRGRSGSLGSDGPIDGRVDQVRRLGDWVTVTGWARPQTVTSPAQIDILLDGQIAARVPANRWRPDLDRAGMQGGACGFAATLPWAPRARMAVRVAAAKAVRTAGR